MKMRILSASTSLFIVAAVLIGCISKDIQKHQQKQNGKEYPNPFSPSTSISYNLPRDEYVTIVIYDINGRSLDTLVHEDQHIGTHLVHPNMQSYKSGVYYYRLITPDTSITKKMIFLK
jgi:hypothetical protein